MTAQAAGSSRAFRVFVSSTFNDFIEERNALQRYVFPRLAELCASRQGRFQAIDLRWGVSEEAGLDQRAVAICLDEIARCQRLTPRPNFIVLLGDRYGWRPLPSRIERAEFEAILAKVPDAGGPESDRTLLGRWYRLDENAEPAEYVLLPREVAAPEVATADARRAAQDAEEKQWWAIEARMRTILLAGVDGLGWKEDDPRRAKYVASATEQEIVRGALEAKDAAEHVFGFNRTILTQDGKPLADAAPADGSAKDYLDATEADGRWVPDTAAHARLVALIEKRLRPLLGKNISDYKATWMSSGITLDHIGDLPEALDDCLKLLEKTDLPHTLCNDVWRNLASMILGQLAKLESEEAVEAEIEAHEVFGEDRCLVFIGREKPLRKIAEYLNANVQRPLAVIGEPGSGKSALMAKAFKQARAAHSRAFTVARFIGATPGSSDGRTLLGNLCRQITRAYGVDESTVPTEYSELAVEFGKRLELATAERPLIVFLDALDQLGATDPARALNWLPASLPDHVQLVVSTVQGDHERTLRAKRPGPQFLPLDRMTRVEGETALGQWLEKAGRTLREPQRKEILDRFEPEGRPLYLKLAFEEARLWPSYDEPSRRVLHEGIPELIRDNLFARLAEPGSHGEMLVSHALAYLAASRYGLSEDELVDVLSADEAVKADFHARSPKSPEVDRLPVVVWSRLYFDLEPYLSEHAGEGTTLLAFYHRQLGEAAAEQYLAGEQERHAAHRGIAQYFQQVADPRGDGNWQSDPRALAELPFHLSSGGQLVEASGLLAQLGYLAARVSVGQAYELVADYSLAEPLSPTLVEWRSFLQRHAQRLSQHPAMLVALVNHEGFATARAQVAALPNPGTWLRTSPEAVSESESDVTEGLSVEVTASLAFHEPRVIAISPDRGAGFVLESLGVLRVLNLHSMRKTETTLPIGREPLLALTSAPDASALVAIYESGVGELYRCSAGPDGMPSNLEPANHFQCHLPEFEAPVVKWHQGQFWFQAGADALGRVSVGEPEVSEQALPAGQTGELAALLFGEDTAIIVLRQGRDTLLLALDGTMQRRPNVEPAAAGECGPGDFAVAFSDGELVTYEGSLTPSPSWEVRAGMIRGQIGWDGSRLLWLDRENNVTACRPGEGVPERVRGTDGLFPRGLLKTPQEWLARPDGTMLALTTHGVDAFRMMHDAGGASGGFAVLFGGSTWRAVDRRGNDWWLIEGQPSRQVLLARALTGRYYCAVDGRDRFYAATGYGSEFVLDLPSLSRVPMHGCPGSLNAAVGDDQDGCWLVDRAGDIYFIDTLGRCRYAAQTGLGEPMGARLLDCQEWLVWFGRSSAVFTDTGPEPAPTLAFFRKRSQGGDAALELVSHQARHPRDGLCVDMWFDGTAGRLISLWAVARDETEPYRLRSGSVEAVAAWRLTETPVTGLGNARYVDGSLSADGKFLGLVTGAGEFRCVRMADGMAVATLAGSLPITSVAPGPGSSEFWLVEARSRPFHCRLIGGDA